MWLKHKKLRNRETDSLRNKLTVSLGSVLETERQRHGGVVLEELGDQVVPPDVVRVLCATNTAEKKLITSVLRLHSMK